MRVAAILALLVLIGCVARKRLSLPPLPPIKKSYKMAYKLATIVPTSLPPNTNWMIFGPADNGWWPIVLGPGTNSTGAQSEY